MRRFEALRERTEGEEYMKMLRERRRQYDISYRRKV